MRGWHEEAHEQQRPKFRDRTEAGALLAHHLAQFYHGDAVVLGIPRGGVVVAAEVARRLGLPLDVIVARKLGAPMSEEFAIGAVTANGGRFLDHELIARLAVSDAYVAAETDLQRAEARRREERFRAGRPPLAVRRRTAIVVDDGLATGSTMRAAVRSLRQHEPARVVVAVPVGSREACAVLRQEADAVVCPFELSELGAVGRYYADFTQTVDDEVGDLLSQSHGDTAPTSWNHRRQPLKGT
jgi:predicted phosphoribosyltransferase